MEWEVRRTPPDKLLMQNRATELTRNEARFRISSLMLGGSAIAASRITIPTGR
jgi:hypothetical protein